MSPVLRVYLYGLDYSPALSTLKSVCLPMPPSYVTVNFRHFTSSVASNATYLSLCHHQLLTNNAILQVTIPCHVNRVNCCCILSLHTTTTLCILYGKPCTTCCVAILYIPVHVTVGCRTCHVVLLYIQTIKTHDCIHLLHKACGSLTTTCGSCSCLPKMLSYICANGAHTVGVKIEFPFRLGCTVNGPKTAT